MSKKNRTNILIKELLSVNGTSAALSLPVVSKGRLLYYSNNCVSAKPAQNEKRAKQDFRELTS